VKITIYNSVGQAVRALVDEVLSSGYHEARWDGANNLGTPVASGVYIYRMEAGDFRAQKRLLYLR
jgi:flagellar hook assembly protein FlgD